MLVDGMEREARIGLNGGSHGMKESVSVCPCGRTSYLSVGDEFSENIE